MISYYAKAKAILLSLLTLLIRIAFFFTTYYMPSSVVFHTHFFLLNPHYNYKHNYNPCYTDERTQDSERLSTLIKSQSQRAAEPELGHRSACAHNHCRTTATLFIKCLKGIPLSILHLPFQVLFELSLNLPLQSCFPLFPFI